MNMNWLRTFITAAEFENFYQASELLYLSQPTVTVHIKKLEKELGVRLFMRKGRNIVLTPYGHEFLVHARNIITHVDEGMDRVEKLRQGYNQTLTIAVSPLIASTYLPYWMKHFLKYNGDVEMMVHVVESNTISDEVDKGLADLGISRMESSAAALFCEKIYEEPVIIVAPHDGGDAESSPPLELEDVVNSHVLLTHNHPEYWDNVLIELKSLFRQIRTMTVTQVHVTKRFIEEGIGFSILPRSTVRRELAEGRMLQVDQPVINLPHAATYLIQKYRSDVANRFTETVKKLV